MSDLGRTMASMQQLRGSVEVELWTVIVGTTTKGRNCSTFRKLCKSWSELVTELERVRSAWVSVLSRYSFPLLKDNHFRSSRVSIKDTWHVWPYCEDTVSQLSHRYGSASFFLSTAAERIALQANRNCCWYSRWSAVRVSLWCILGNLNGSKLLLSYTAINILWNRSLSSRHCC